MSNQAEIQNVHFCAALLIQLMYNPIPEDTRKRKVNQIGRSIPNGTKKFPLNLITFQILKLDWHFRVL